MKKIKFFESISKNMVNNTNEARPYFNLLGIIIIFSYAFFYFLNQVVIEPNRDENLYIRTFICVLGITLTFHKSWEKHYRELSPMFFYFTIFISFGFFFSYMLFKNPHSNIWQINELTGLILLSIFLDWRSFATLTILSVALAFIFATSAPYTDYEHLIGIFCSYSSPIICLFIFTERQKNLQNERNTYNLHIKEINESLELKIKERTEELQKALAAKTEFLNNMSHEIRTPLHGFSNISEGLVEHWSSLDESKRYNYAVQVSDSAKRLFSLVSDVLDLSKLTANKMLVRLQKAVINDLFKDIIQECHSLYLSNKHINIIFLPHKNFIANVDPERMKQVFRNVLFNAIKFTPSNGEIRINIESLHDEIHISIADTGSGVPDEELEDIFASFIQSSRTKTGANGTGLGLSIAKGIIIAHHGKIWAENNPVIGATFYIILPARL